MARKDKREIMAMAAAILLAFIMWIYVMSDTNPPINGSIEVPVKLINQDAIQQNNLILVPDQIFTVNLKISGNATDVYKASPSDFEAVADMNGVYLKKGDNTVLVQVIKSAKGVSVISASGEPNYIKVRLDALTYKSVHVNVGVEGNPNQGYSYLNPVVKPSEVIVSGPDALVSKVTAVTGQIDISGNTTDEVGSVLVKPLDKDGNVIPNLNMEPDKIVNVTVPVRPSKEVPIVVQDVGSPAGDKTIKSIIPSISKITIIGARNVIDKINAIKTLPYDVSRISSTFTDNLNLDIPDGVSTFNNVTSVSVQFIVENIVESVVNVPYTLLNTQQGYNYSFSPSDIPVTIRAPESVINSLNANAVTATADVGGLTEGEHSVPIKVTVPDGVSIVKYSPDKITVVITKQ